MTNFKSAIKLLVIAACVVGAGVFVMTNWSWVFSKRIKGEILNVERVTDPAAILSPRATDAQIHSYSILIRGEDGRLYTSSSEDRQWQVAKKGFCVEARLYRNPPWALDKSNTFFNARLLELSLCAGKPEPTEPASPAPADPPPTH